MTVRSFVDTNVLVYADDAEQEEKRRVCLALLARLHRERRGVLSLQVLREYYVTAVGKLGVPSDVARQKVIGFSELEVVRLDLDDLFAAIDLHRLHAFSLWDALIVRAAVVSRCRVLYTEDLQHGRRIDAIEIRNPFQERP